MKNTSEKTTIIADKEKAGGIVLLLLYFCLAWAFTQKAGASLADFLPPGESNWVKNLNWNKNAGKWNLSWQCLSDLNEGLFILYKSDDGKHYLPVAIRMPFQKDSHGNYQIEESNISSVKSTYKLCFLEKSGKVFSTGTIESASRIMNVPNPLK